MTSVEWFTETMSVACKDTMLVNAVVRHLLPETRPLRVYEAGGGSFSALAPSILENAHTMLVDISPEQVAACRYASEAEVGNIETWRRPDGFDLVVCHNVLEHVDAPHAALDAMAASTAPGGAMLLAGPVPTSLQGWVTRLTPHIVHIWFYRFVFGSKTAGLPGHLPFRTRFKKGSNDRDMRRILEDKGFRVVYASRSRAGHAQGLADKNMALFHIYRAVCLITRALSLGTYDPSFTNFSLVAVRPPAA